jgi:deoxyribonuclease-1-like protein
MNQGGFAMQKPKLALLGILLAAAGWFFFKNFEVTKDFQIRGKSPSAATATASSELPPAAEGESILVATFNIEILGDMKISKPDVLDKLARICGAFDVVAIQELRSKNGEGVIQQLAAAIKSTSGRTMSYVIGERLGNSSSKEQYVYLYDQASILCDVEQVYTVADPDQLLHRPPLVAQFRARKPNPQDAFTFILANIHTDPDMAIAETDAMQLVLGAVLADGRNEDDVILLGDFNTSNKRLGRLGEVKGLVDVLRDEPTTPNGKNQYDHIFFLQFATREFLRGGVLDTVREFRISLEEAEEISDHLPVWAEFSIYEGGAPSTLATRSEENSSR